MSLKTPGLGCDRGGKEPVFVNGRKSEGGGSWYRLCNCNNWGSSPFSLRLWEKERGLDLEKERGFLESIHKGTVPGSCGVGGGGEFCFPNSSAPAPLHSNGPVFRIPFTKLPAHPVSPGQPWL